jgi:hypothetical protein
MTSLEAFGGLGSRSGREGRDNGDDNDNDNVTAKLSTLSSRCGRWHDKEARLLTFGSVSDTLVKISAKAKVSHCGCSSVHCLTITHAFMLQMRMFLDLRWVYQLCSCPCYFQGLHHRRLPELAASCTLIDEQVVIGTAFGSMAKMDRQRMVYHSVFPSS